MEYIALTQGKLAIVDTIDFPLLNRYKWHYGVVGRNGGYAVRNVARPDFGIVYLHKMVAERAGLRGEIDHRNRNRLDNRRENLRESSHSNNIGNAGIRVNNTSGFKGVSWRKDRNKWRAYIMKNRRQIQLGHYNTPEEAAAAHDRAAARIYGEFAVLNFP